MTSPELLYFTLFVIYYGLSEVAHLLFSLKYWILSKRLKAITSNVEDKHLELKSYAILLITLTIIISSIVVYRLTENPSY